MIKYCITRFREQDGKQYYTDIFNDILSVTFCNLKYDKIYKVDVREAKEDEETPYIGWLTPDGNIDYIFPHRIMLETCFAYGSKAETERERGKVIRVFIEELT